MGMMSKLDLLGEVTRLLVPVTAGEQGART